jgi:hypothetical protein
VRKDAVYGNHQREDITIFNLRSSI